MIQPGALQCTKETESIRTDHIFFSSLLKNKKIPSENNTNQAGPQSVKPFPEKNKLKSLSPKSGFSRWNCGVSLYFENASSR
jgi:hypothetical protein